MHRLLVVLALVAACGDNGTRPPIDDSPPDTPEDPCPPLELGTARLQFNFGSLTGIRYPIKSGDLKGSFLLVELYDSNSPDLPPLAPGTFDLTSPQNSNLRTCQHCVFIAKDRPDGTLDVSYYQTKGSVQLTQITDPLEAVFAGSVTAELHAATADEVGNTTLVTNGACRRIDALAFDTTPVAGACTTLSDCSNEMLQVCDPKSQQCVEPQCDFDFGGCTETQACVPQLDNAFYGACYDACDPTGANTCGAGQTCVQQSPNPYFGLCKPEGTGAEGATCEVADASTSCIGELACSVDSGTCAAACDLFADGATGCSADTRCSYFGRCEPPQVADPVTFGQKCTSAARLATPCAVDAIGLQGYCYAPREQDPLYCVEACLDDGDCATDHFCAPRFSSGLGACIPDPICGDGLLGEQGEVCDDGNSTVDTCSDDCQTVDYDVSCRAGQLITDNATLTGDTRTGLDGFQTTCQAGRARTSLYEYSPAQPGRLTITVDSMGNNAAVSVLETCEAIPTELACRIHEPTDTDAIVTQLRTTDTVWIAVAGYTVLEEGPHSIHIDFKPEDCGDSIVEGNEVCDDGNEVSGDGCSGNCRTIEYDAICTNATPLSLTAPNTGTTVGAPPLYTNSCSPTATGVDRVYTFTAPAAGTLKLALDEGSHDLALAVFNGCGAPADITELACSSVYGLEMAEVPLAANQQVTVVVDGFNTDDAGPYTLTATFQ
jgi:cysteine-rich repeat protein